MATVKNILDFKGRLVWYATPGTPVIDALKILKDRNIGALVVLEGSQIIGIFSERDFARRAPTCDECDIQSPVRDYMTAIVLGVTESETVENCMAIMSAQHIRHLPVINDQNIVIGMISVGDVIKQLIVEREESIKYLQDYIWYHMI